MFPFDMKALTNLLMTHWSNLYLKYPIQPFDIGTQICLIKAEFIATKISLFQLTLYLVETGG